MVSFRPFIMRKLACPDNAALAAAREANGVASPSRRELILGALIVYGLLFSGMVGRSKLIASSGYRWRVQMSVVTVTVIGGLLFVAWKRSRQRTHRQSSELPSAVKTCLAGLLGTAVASSIVQENWLGNLAFLIVFAGMAYLLCVNGVMLIRGIPSEWRIDVALVPLGLMAVHSMLTQSASSSWSRYHTRFNGLYSDAIVAGQMFGLTCLLLLWSILHTRSKRIWGYWALLPVAGFCLALTRTRTDLLATTIAMLTCLCATMRSSATALPRRRARAILALLLLSLVISTIWLTQRGIDTGRVKTYLRVDAEPEDILDSRAEHWRRGVENLSITDIFGEGPLAKFGGELSTTGGVYVRDLNMHNAFLSTFQYYGWPGGIMFIVFLLSAGGIFLRRRDPYASLGLSLLTFGLVQCLTENWLLSFGNPADAYSWFILGIALPHSASGMTREMNGSKRHVLADRRIRPCLSPYLFRR
jgi:hypothetical protein